MTRRCAFELPNLLHASMEIDLCLSSFAATFLCRHQETNLANTEIFNKQIKKFQKKNSATKNSINLPPKPFQEQFFPFFSVSPNVQMPMTEDYFESHRLHCRLEKRFVVHKM